MTRTEINERIDTIKSRIFLVQMIDRWTDEDREYLRELQNELRELQAQL